MHGYPLPHADIYLSVAEHICGRAGSGISYRAGIGLLKLENSGIANTHTHVKHIHYQLLLFLATNEVFQAMNIFPILYPLSFVYGQGQYRVTLLSVFCCSSCSETDSTDLLGSKCMIVMGRTAWPWKTRADLPQPP